MNDLERWARWCKTEMGRSLVDKYEPIMLRTVFMAGALWQPKKEGLFDKSEEPKQKGT